MEKSLFLGYHLEFRSQSNQINGKLATNYNFHFNLMVLIKVLMQGKLIAVVYCILCVHIETSSLWAEFVNKNRCISVRLVSE